MTATESGQLIGAFAGCRCSNGNSAGAMGFKLCVTPQPSPAFRCLMNCETGALKEGQMFAGEMRKTYALSLVQNFPPLPKGRPFPRIAESDIVAGLADRIQDPTQQHQGAAGLCGPAAFFYCVLNYKPELYVQYVIDLFTTGKARIGSLEVKPGAACRVYQPPRGRIHPVDWVALASLRDSDNM